MGIGFLCNRDAVSGSPKPGETDGGFTAGKGLQTPSSPFIAFSNKIKGFHFFVGLTREMP